MIGLFSGKDLPKRCYDTCSQHSEEKAEPSDRDPLVRPCASCSLYSHGYVYESPKKCNNIRRYLLAASVVFLLLVPFAAYRYVMHCTSARPAAPGHELAPVDTKAVGPLPMTPIDLDPNSPEYNATTYMWGVYSFGDPSCQEMLQVVEHGYEPTMDCQLKWGAGLTTNIIQNPGVSIFGLCYYFDPDCQNPADKQARTDRCIVNKQYELKGWKVLSINDNC